MNPRGFFLRSLRYSFSVLLFSLTSAHAANVPEPGELMGHTCAACHGTYGRLGDEAFVPLAGMPVKQFVRSMRDFREGKRPSTLMGHVANGFNDAELQAMGVFFVSISRTGARR